ncbi:MAG: TetR/AcrR family transcriptional regulator [Myxococcota bacterium]
MARGKSFEPEEKLRLAMAAFWDHGYEACSMQVLLDAMGISRQSLYDTFGDKRSLFLQSLTLYEREQGAELASALALEGSARRHLESLFLGIAAEAPHDRHRGCLMVKAAVEGLGAESDINDILCRNTRSCQRAFRALLQRGKADGEWPPWLVPDEAAEFLFSVFQGIRVSAQSGASPKSLRQTAKLALRALDSGGDPNEHVFD